MEGHADWNSTDCLISSRDVVPRDLHEPPFRKELLRGGGQEIDVGQIDRPCQFQGGGRQPLSKATSAGARVHCYRSEQPAVGMDFESRHSHDAVAVTRHECRGQAVCDTVERQLVVGEQFQNRGRVF